MNMEEIKVGMKVLVLANKSKEELVNTFHPGIRMRKEGDAMVRKPVRFRMVHKITHHEQAARRLTGVVEEINAKTVLVRMTGTGKTIKRKPDQLREYTKKGKSS